MQPAFVYDLDFVSRTTSLSRKPEIAIHLSEATFETVLRGMRNLTDGWDRAREYLSSEKPPVLHGEYIGYGRCCRVLRCDEGVSVYLMLQRSKLREVVVTLVLLTSALRGCYRGGDAGHDEKQQLLDIGTYINPTPHGHCPEGRSFPVFGRWLKRQVGDVGCTTAVQVREAMMEGWRAVAPLASRSYADESNCHFAEDGRFALGCFGDSCDLAIYPDGVIGDVGEYAARIHSHNVESAHEQITLLCGLAALCGLARRELKGK